MKKIFIGIFIFAIISFLITGTLIAMKTGKLVGYTNEFDANNIGNQNNDLNEEKTLDLYGTYDENDLIIKEKKINIENVYEELEIPQISGLKNKEVESKVNQDIEKRIVDKIKEISANGELGNRPTYSRVNGNFANVLSMEYHISHSPIIGQDRI